MKIEQTIEKPNQVKKYTLSAFFSLVVGLFLLAGGIWMLFFTAKPHLFITWFIICFGIVSIAVGVKQWFSVSWRKVLFVEKRSISLRDGEITIDEPACPYELWMFCEVPFFYYNGSIRIAKGSTEEIQNISVPRRSPWLIWWWRSELYGLPIKWRSPKNNGQGRCSIKFNLSPTFTDTVFSDVIPARDIELVTILVKAMQPKRS